MKTLIAIALAAATFASAGLVHAHGARPAQ